MEDSIKANLRAQQVEMRKNVNTSVPLEHPRYIAGADLTVEDDLMIGCIVIVDADDDCKVLYSRNESMSVDIPYIPGLLCFREGPVVIRLLELVREERPDIHIDLILCDGCGEWHPRGFGLACYVGLVTGIPTIGVSKTFLFVGSNDHGKEVQRNVQTRLNGVGDYELLEHDVKGGYHIQCAVMRTTTSVPFKPIFISCGHLIDMPSAVDAVRRVCKFREPEPVRLADRISRNYVKQIKAQRNNDFNSMVL